MGKPDIITPSVGAGRTGGLKVGKPACVLQAKPNDGAVQTDGFAQPPFLRIAQVLNRMDSGGIEAVVLNYYRHIDRSKVQFDFYFAEASCLPQRQELERLGAGLYTIPRYSSPIAYHRALYAAFTRRGYGIVHAHLSTMSIFPLFAAWRAGVPVRICHNHSTAHWGDGVKTLLKYILRPFNKIFATEWVACGEAAGRWMYGNQAFDAGKVTVMPNAIDTAKFAYDPDARRRLRNELGISQNAFVVGHVGRFTYAKNHKFLLQIFAELLKMRPNACLLLVGEGELRQQIRQKAEAIELQNKVIFTGARQDTDKLYSAMDVFCLPSRYEGMPACCQTKSAVRRARGYPAGFSIYEKAAGSGRRAWLGCPGVPRPIRRTLLHRLHGYSISICCAGPIGAA